MGLESFADCPNEWEKEILRKMLRASTIEKDMREDVYNEIDACENYAHYQRLYFFLENAQQSIHEIINPIPADVNRHLRKFIF